MFRKELPRVYEVLELPACPPNRYGQNLESELQNDPEKTGRPWQVWLAWENALEKLDRESLQILKQKVSACLAKKEAGRGWRELFDKMNEVWAYNWLRDMGCTKICFVPEGKKRTPDLKAWLNAVPLYCEVKTINISDDEVRVRQGETVGDAGRPLAPGFFSKLESDLKDAKEQFDSCDEGKRFIYIVIKFDDSLGEYKDDLYRQIDNWLPSVADKLTGIELMFHNLQTVFEKTIVMKNAGVFNEAAAWKKRSKTRSN